MKLNFMQNGKKELIYYLLNDLICLFKKIIIILYKELFYINYVNMIYVSGEGGGFVYYN